MLFIDMESYYDQEYSLTKLPTWQYIRDPRFRLLGCAVWHPGMDEIKYIHTFQAVAAFLHANKGKPIVAHNAAFDGAILSHHFGIHAPYNYCTKLMARYLISQGLLPPDQKTSLADLTGQKGDTAEAVAAGGHELAEYGINDLRLLMQLFKKFYPQIPQIELDLMDLHVKMSTQPVLNLNKPLLREVASRRPHPLAVQLRKKDPFVKALTALGIEPGTKISPTTEKEVYAFAKTDSFMQELARHEDPRVRKLHELRTEGNSNIKQTRAQRFLDVGEPFPVPLLYGGGHTLRSSGMDKLNLQNLPRGGELRHALLAQRRYKLIKIDLSQIEVRTLGYGAGDKNLLQIFRDNLDPYIAFAADVIFRKNYDDVTKEERKICKAPILASGYGQGEDGLIDYAAGMGIYLTPEQAAQGISGYHRQFTRVKPWWDELMNELRRTGQLHLPSDRKLIYPDRFYKGRRLYYQKPLIFSSKRKGEREEKGIWYGLLANNYSQGLARDVVMWQTNILAKKYKVVLSVHDEAVLHVPEDQAEEALAEAMEVYATAPPWAPDLPVKGEGEILDHYK